MKKLMSLAFAGLLIAGCADSGEFSWETHTWTTDHGVYAMDHVSRNKVETERAVKRTYLGETYYFENEADARTFDQHPWSYLYYDNTQTCRPDRTDQN